jgi:methyl-accepting chemotaxis protein
MISAGEVEAVFELTDRVSSVLQRIASQFERLDAIINQTKASLDTLRLPQGVISGVTKMNEQLAAISGSADRAALGTSAAFDEQVFRFNAREGTDSDRFKTVLSWVAGLRLTYNELTGHEPEVAPT